MEKARRYSSSSFNQTGHLCAFFFFSLSASDCSAALCGIVRVVQPLADALLRMDEWVDGWTDGGAGVEV